MRVLRSGFIVTALFWAMRVQAWGEPENDPQLEMKVALSVADTVFSSNRGYYDDPFNLVISCATPESFILYTIDGSLPSTDNGEAGKKDEPVILRLEGTTIVRAMALRDGMVPSDIDTHTYLFRDDILTQGRPDWAPKKVDFGMDTEIVGDTRSAEKLRDSFLKAPSVSLVMENQDLFGGKGIYTNPLESGKGWEKPVSLEWISPNGGKDFNSTCGIRIQGTGSRDTSSKKNFRLKFSSRFGPKKLKEKVFLDSEVCEFDSLVLRNPTHDSWLAVNPDWRKNARYVNDRWASETQRRMGHPSPHQRWVHLYLNGFYWGIYSLSERPDESFMASYFGGKKSDYDVLNANQLRNGSRDNFDRARDLIRIQGCETREAYEEIQKLVDLDALIDYFLYNVYSGNIDWPHKNYWIGGKRGGDPKFRYLNWDAEIGFFEHWKSMRNPKALNSLTLNPLRSNTMLMDLHGAAFFYHRLKRTPDFRVKMADRIRRHTQAGGVLSPEEVGTHYRDLLDEIEPLLLLESARWGDSRREMPFSPLSAEWKKNTSESSWLFREFFPKRSKMLIEHFREDGGYPKLDPPSARIEKAGIVFILNPNTEGVVYYTVDGSDPREEWSGRKRGSVYQNPLEVTGETLVNARIYRDGEWSALEQTPNVLQE
jgi:hypothetical protein